VPVADKVCIIFEPHSDIIVKGRRDVQFGHKLNITTGKSGMVLDVVIEQGNPADTAQLCPMIARQEAIYGRVPRQTAADCGFASQSNLKQDKEMGVKDVSFNKKKRPKR
jgi:IS5 family transposase